MTTPTAIPRDLAPSVRKGMLNGRANSTDPALTIQGMPPNFGQPALAHPITFVGIISSPSKVYRYSDEALKDSFANARNMRNDTVLRECIDTRMRCTALLNWHLEPDDEKDPQQKQLVEDLTGIVQQCKRFMQYREILLEAIWYGRYAAQHYFRWKRLKGKMRLVLDRWLPLHGDKIVFRYDDGSHDYDPDQVGIRIGAGFASGNVAKNWTTGNTRKVEPTDYGLAYFLEPWERPLLAIHKHKIEDGEYEDPLSAGRVHGTGIRSVLYWTWYQKQETLAWLMEYIERSAFGIEIWYYPWGNDAARAQMQKAAEERIGLGRNIVLVPKPLGDDSMAYGVDRIEPGMAGADICLKIVHEYFGHALKRYILGQTLTSEASGTGLGSNLASVQLDTLLQIIKYDATLLEETITEDLIVHLKDWNFPWAADIPVRFKIDTEDQDMDHKLEAIQKSWEMGLKIDAQTIRDTIGMEKPSADAEILQNPEMAKLSMVQEGKLPPEALGGGMGNPQDGDGDGFSGEGQEYAANGSHRNGSATVFGPMPHSEMAMELWKNLMAERDALVLEKALGLQQSENSERERVGNAEPVQQQLPFVEPEANGLADQIKAEFERPAGPRPALREALKQEFAARGW